METLKQVLLVSLLAAGVGAQSKWETEPGI